MKHLKKETPKKHIRNRTLIMLILMMSAACCVLVFEINDIYVTNFREDMNRSGEVSLDCLSFAAQDFSAASESVADTVSAVIEDKKWKGPVLSKGKGVIHGPSGKETYYNLNMSVCVRYMQRLGYDYEYWVRDDGVKMFGDYVMIAANLKLRPKGSIVMTSLGPGIVCDTGGFAKRNPTQIDIATTW